MGRLTQCSSALWKAWHKAENWMFAGSEGAGKRAAVIQSLRATTRANGLMPLAWLTNTLEKLPPAKGDSAAWVVSGMIRRRLAVSRIVPSQSECDIAN